MTARVLVRPSSASRRSIGPASRVASSKSRPSASAAQRRGRLRDLCIRPAFNQGMGEALLVGLKVAALGAVLVLLFLPARGREELPVRQGIVEVEAARMDGLPGAGSFAR